MICKDCPAGKRILRNGHRCVRCRLYGMILKEDHNCDREGWEDYVRLYDLNGDGEEEAGLQVNSNGTAPEVPGVLRGSGE